MVSGEMLSLHDLLTFGNAQTSLAMLSLNRRFLGLDAECGDQRCHGFAIFKSQSNFDWVVW